MNFKQLLLTLPLVLPMAAASAASAPWVGTDFSGIACAGNPQGYGPFDYTKKETYPAENLNLVEHAHFTPSVENLVAGNTASIPADLDYTLRAWPNHHRALLSVIRYKLKIDNKLAKDKFDTPPECYFQRAMRFNPNDAVTVSLYGFFLRKMGRYKEAVKPYEEAIRLAPDTSKIEYAYSLLLIDLKQYDKALTYAKNAYAHGKPPNGLKNKLVKLGVWK